MVNAQQIENAKNSTPAPVNNNRTAQDVNDTDQIAHALVKATEALNMAGKYKSTPAAVRAAIAKAQALLIQAHDKAEAANERIGESVWQALTTASTPAEKMAQEFGRFAKPGHRLARNLMSRKVFEIANDTPHCCDPSGETYWSM